MLYFYIFVFSCNFIKLCSFINLVCFPIAHPLFLMKNRAEEAEKNCEIPVRCVWREATRTREIAFKICFDLDLKLNTCMNGNSDPYLVYSFHNKLSSILKFLTMIDPDLSTWKWIFWICVIIMKHGRDSMNTSRR